MQHYFSLLLLLSILFTKPLQAQQFDSLPVLKGHAVQVYYSAGHEPRARAITQRVDNAMAYYEQLLGFKPTVTLLVLSAADWKKYATSQAVYGMPHYMNEKTLFVAAEDNQFWRIFLPPLDQLPPALRKQIQIVYSSGDSSVSMQAFFDLLAIHELGHAFLMQGGLIMQRKWMGELFANILLHTYIAENEPASLPALTLFPKMVVGGGSKEFTYTSLADIEEKYGEIARQRPKNYGWYQCRWHAAAATIYDAAGKQVCRKLWDALKNKKEKLSDAELIDFLATADKSVADMVKNWDGE